LEEFKFFLPLIEDKWFCAKINERAIDINSFFDPNSFCDPPITGNGDREDGGGDVREDDGVDIVEDELERIGPGIVSAIGVVGREAILPFFSSHLREARCKACSAFGNCSNNST
jgi:hypothetical protein